MTIREILNGEYCPITGCKLKDYVERTGSYVYAPPGDFVSEWEVKKPPKPPKIPLKEREQIRYQRDKEKKREYYIKRKIEACKQS